MLAADPMPARAERDGGRRIGKMTSTPDGPKTRRPDSGVGSVHYLWAIHCIRSGDPCMGER